MKSALLLCALAATLAVALGRYKTADFSDRERWEAATQAVEETKVKIAAMEAKAKSASSDDAAARLLSRSFRRASAKSIEIGKARHFMEAAVRSAERKLLEKARAKTASVSSKAQKAEMLAEELLHTPGTLLAPKEISHIYSESGCEETREEVDCETVPFVDTIRTADGTCNNFEHSTQGSSITRFRRILPPRYEDGISQLNGLLQSQLGDLKLHGPFAPPNPSARLVSSTIVRDRIEDESELTHLVMQWGQFIDHDLDLAVENFEVTCDLVTCEITDFCAPVQVPMDDQTFGVGTPRNGNCHPFVRTIPACEEEEDGAHSPRQQINELTSYIDGSNVYGSTQERADFLREFTDGLLRVGPNIPTNGGKPSLPPIPPCPDGGTDCCPPGFDECFVAGDVRVNEQVSLTVMHTIWMREHNRIATELKVLNPEFDDERLYQEARRIVGAMIQKITLYDYLPKILGQQTFDALVGDYLGYQESVDASVPNAFATAAYRFGHSQIQPQFDRLMPDLKTQIENGPLSLVDAFMNPGAYEDSEGTDPIVRGWITQPARRLDEFLNSILTTQLFERADSPGLDLATLNIQRSRDHGIPPYPIWKNFCMNKFNISSDFTNELTKIRFLQTYGALDTVDLWVGGLAEEPLPGGVVGATFACIFALTFDAVRTGDRFWYENQDPEYQVFTPAQLAQIQNANIGRVLCDNGDAIGTMQSDAFLQGNQAPCFFLPRVDLSPWNEDPLCYQKVDFLPHSRATLDFDFLSTTSSSIGDLKNYPVMLTPSVSTVTKCIPFECPTTSANTNIFNFPAIVNGDLSNFLECTHTVNPELPPSSSSPGSESLYHAAWLQSHITGSSGLFSSLSACEAGTTVALTYDCGPVAASRSNKRSTMEELEKELAKVLASDTAGVTATTRTRGISKTYLGRYDLLKHARSIPDKVMRVIKEALGSSNVQHTTHHSMSSDPISQAEKEELVDLLKETLERLDN